MNMITDYVPGAWMTDDQLHVRGGHQVTWAIDGVPIPNTNIASNVGPQIDPKDIDYLEAQRGGYSSVYGDRSYGVFNVVPRTGFERNSEGEFYSTYGSFNQTNDQINFGSHTEKFAYFGSLNGNRSDYGLSTPGPDVLHDRVWGPGGMATLIYSTGPKDQLRFVTTLRRDDYQIPNDPDTEVAGVRDIERERDAVVSLSWVHTFAPNVLLTESPFTISIAPIMTEIRTIRRLEQPSIAIRNTRALRLRSRPSRSSTMPWVRFTVLGSMTMSRSTYEEMTARGTLVV
jgi:hypothetical protein